MIWLYDVIWRCFFHFWFVLLHQYLFFDPFLAKSNVVLITKHTHICTHTHTHPHYEPKTLFGFCTSGCTLCACFLISSCVVDMSDLLKLSQKTLFEKNFCVHSKPEQQKINCLNEMYRKIVNIAEYSMKVASQQIH